MDEPDAVVKLAPLVNLLIGDAQKQLADNRHTGLVVIVDGLERMLFRTYEGGRNSHEDLFITHADQLCSPGCHLIYTIPVSLVYNRNVIQNFDGCEVIPMVAIRQRDGEPNTQGREKLREVIERRFDVGAIFADANQLDRLIEMSGGHVGELLRLIRYSFDYSDDQVQPEAIARALQKLVNDYDRLTKDRDLPTLHRVHEKRDASGDPDTAPSLLDLLILEYNGERWADVHPAVQATRKFQESKPKETAPKKRPPKKK